MFEEEKCEETSMNSFINELAERLIGKKKESLLTQEIREFLSCSKNKQVVVKKSVSPYLAGLYSIGIEEIIKQYEFFVKNYDREGEEPPIFIDWPISYDEKRNCLIEGFYFVKDKTPFIISISQGMMAFHINIVLPIDKKNAGLEFLKELDTWVKKNNFYKGKVIESKEEHGSLYFDFLPPINKNWGNVVLSKMQVDEIYENVLVPIEHSDVLRRLNKTSSRSILFTGEPGTGKTLTLKILSEQIKDYTRIWVSSSILWRYGAVPQVFSVARSLKPSVLILEDFDLVGRKREDVMFEALGNLLMELDGQKANDGVIILITSNNPEAIDKALMRPGRIDKTIYFPSPDEHQRHSLLKLFLKGHPSDININELAKKTEGYKGANLKELVTSAILKAIRRDPKNPKIVNSDFKIKQQI